MVRQRHLPRQGQLAPTDQPDIRDGMRRGATRVRGDDGGVGARAAAVRTRAPRPGFRAGT
jgi:hypothetical protein